MREEKKNPKARAQHYQDEQAAGNEPTQSPEAVESQSTPRVHRTPEQWQDLVSQRIEEAMQNGAFDNLRNKGKPIDPAPDPYTPSDMQMANSLLRNNDLAPAWISERKAVLAAIDRFRARLGAICTEFREERSAVQTPLQRERLEQAWQLQLEKWRTEIVELNRRIQNQNLSQPITFLEILKLRLDDELRRHNMPPH